MKNYKTLIRKISIRLLIICVFTILQNCKRDSCEYTNECYTTRSVNVSTGVDDKGIAIADGATASLWVMSSCPAPLIAGSPTKVTPANSAWQSVPVITTNAKWVNGTGTSSSPSGNYIFERSITVLPGTTNLSFNFSIAQDDVFVSLVLVKPDASTIPITVTPTTAFHLSVPITNTITNPMAGIWKIRSTINFIDSLGGFLASGNVSLTEPCK